MGIRVGLHLEVVVVFVEHRVPLHKVVVRLVRGLQRLQMTLNLTQVVAVVAVDIVHHHPPASGVMVVPV